MYNDVKLEKGLYNLSGKSFTAALEELDPSSSYSGTPLEKLDAYERQLKRFNIRISGADCDRVEKFFSAAETAVPSPSSFQDLSEKDSMKPFFPTSVPLRQTVKAVSISAVLLMIQPLIRLQRREQRSRLLQSPSLLPLQFSPSTADLSTLHTKQYAVRDSTFSALCSEVSA